MNEKYARIKGFADMFPPDSEQFTAMEGIARRVFAACGFRELRTPLMEYTDLFRRSIGQETDVVQKEMYTFADAHGRNLSLRPEATAGVLRAAIEAGVLARDGVQRLFTIGPMFRHERPQKGRMRQFHQINCECLGSPSPLADAELIAMLLRFLSGLEISGLTLKLNSLGCRACRPAYHERLRAFLAEIAGQCICDDCRRRMTTNPLRVLDCKQPGCREILSRAPHLLDHVCGDCKNHFSAVLRLLESRGIACELDHNLVRGLDYYCRTTFEVVSNEIGAQTAVAGGGRYDGLVGSLGGPDVPGVGFACGMERLALLMREPVREKQDFFIACLGDDASFQAFGLAQTLRDNGLSGEICLRDGSLKSQLRLANRQCASFCLIIGPDEAGERTVVIRNMAGGGQQTVPQANAAASLRQWKQE